MIVIEEISEMPVKAPFIEYDDVVQALAGEWVPMTARHKHVARASVAQTRPV
jgi:hypothetical protein